MINGLNVPTIGILAFIIDANRNILINKVEVENTILKLRENNYCIKEDVFNNVLSKLV